MRVPALVCLSLAAVVLGCGRTPPGEHARSAGMFEAGRSWSPAQAEVALGARLFFDPRLSRTGKVSCGTCHDPRHAFAEPRAVGIGVDGRKGSRNTPTVLGTAQMPRLFWDGRAGSLEEQALGPIANPLEMDADPDAVAVRLAAVPMYARLFERAYGGPPTRERLGKAIAAFERALARGEAPYDRWRAGDAAAIPPAAARGAATFERAGCAGCHAGPAFSDHGFHDVGHETGDPGRANVTGDPADRGAFKTPSLRDVAETAPYMHDGGVATLEGAIAAHRKTVPALAPGERADVVAFLRTLSGGHNLKKLVPDLVEPR